jgi:uncharacterized protein (DUF697 family)
MHNYNAPDYTRSAHHSDGGYANGSATNEYEWYAQQEYEYESNEELEADTEATFSETLQSELAGEMPSGENETEMEHFMQRLLQRAVGSKRMSSNRQLTRTLRRLLRGLATRLFDKKRSGGHSFSHSTGEVNSSLQSEVFGNESEFESRRAFVRMAGNAARRAYGMRGNYSPDHRVRTALKGAAHRFLPALLRLRRYHKHSKHIAARLSSLEQSLMQLSDKIAGMRPGADAPPASQNGDGDSEYELYNEFEENEFEDNEYGENEFEENEYEDNEFEENENEYEENEYEEEYENEFEDNESEDNEYEYESEYEDNESEEGEYEDNEQRPRRRRKKRLCCRKCGKRPGPQNEYEENEYEEEHEHEFEEEYEDNESENEYEENEMESESELEATFNETDQLELASELLAVQSEYELDQFLGKLIKKAKRALKSVAKIAVPGPLAGMLKKVAKVALPIAGGIAGGTFAPGIGNIIGKKLGGAAANMFELELEGLSAEDQEFEKARAFVRFAGNAVNRSTLLRKPVTPAKRANVAFRHAARRYAPGLLRRQRAMRRRALQQRRRMVPNRRRYNGRPLGRPYAPGAAQTHHSALHMQHVDQLMNYPDHSQNDAGLLNNKMQSLENLIRQLNERVDSFQGQNAGGNEGNNNPESAGVADGGSENEYWN